MAGTPADSRGWGCDTSPLYGSDVQNSSVSHLLAQQIRRSDFVFCISGVQTSPLYGSDVQTSSVSHFFSTAGQTFRLRLLHIRRSNFAFIWIRCSDFIYITFSSTVGQTFRLRLLHIRRSDFVFIWIRCSDFICITFASTAGRTSSSAYQAFRLRLYMDQIFRLRLLRIRRSDFAFIWIRCTDFICITFPSTAVRLSDFIFYISSIQTSLLYGSDVHTSSVSHFIAPQLDFQTSSSVYQAFRLRLYMDQMFRLRLYMDQMFRLHLYHIC